MPDENYEYSLRASAGGTNAALKFLESGEVQCEVRWSAMGNKGYHYRLYGKQEPISEAYGWIRVHQVEDALQSSVMQIPVEALGAELIYEYVKVPRGRFLQHPEDMLWQAAHWNEFFDLILFTSHFAFECLEALKYAIAEGTLEENEPANMAAQINDTFIEHLTNLLVSLDKMKFTKIQLAESSATGGT